MSKQNILIASTIVAIGIASLGMFIKSGIVHFKESERVVVVKGLAERSVEANNVIWPISYKIVGNNLSSLYNEMEQNNQQIIRFLTASGIQSADISTATPNVIDFKADSYRNQNEIPFRYNISSTVTVTSSEVEKVRASMANVTELMKAGIAVSSERYGASSVSFNYTSLNDIKPDMIQQATQNARSAAEKFAFDSQSKLGKIKRATQGQFSISVTDKSAPHKKTVRIVTTIEYYLRD
jgi:hypothetical protein